MPAPVTSPARSANRFVRRARVSCLATVATALCAFVIVIVPGAVARAETARLVLFEQPFVATETGQRFVLGTVPGAGGDAEVVVAVHPPVISRAALRSIADREVGLRTNVDVLTVPYRSLPPGAPGRLQMPVDFSVNGGSAATLDLKRPGIYPVTISVVQEGETLAETVTFVVRPEDRDGDSPERTPLTLLAGTGTGLSHAPDGSPAVSEETRAAVRSLVSLEELSGAMITPMITPETLHAIGSSGDPSDATLLAEVRAGLTGSEFPVDTFVAVDVSRLVAEGISPELVTQFRLSEDTLARHLPGVRAVRGVHVTRRPLTAEGARALADLGLRTIVFGGESLAGAPMAPRPGVITEFALPGDIRMRALQMITGLDEVLSPPDSDADNPVASEAERSARVAAEIMAERADLLAEGVDPGTLHFVVDLGGVSGSERVASQAAVHLADIDDFRASPLTVADSAPPAESANADPLTAAPEYEPRLINAIMFTLNVRRDAVVSMLPAGDPRPARWATQLGIVPSLEPGEGLEQWSAALQTELDAITSSISVSATSDITLGSRTGTIRIRLRNDSDTALTVRVRLVSAKLRFPGGPKVVTLQAGGVTDVDVTVSARSNGRFPVTMEVLTPQGQRPIVAPITLTTRVTAVAGLGQLVSVTVALVLMAWWFSNWRRGRTRRPDSAEADAG